MALIKNQFGTLDLPSTVTALDERVTALEAFVPDEDLSDRVAKLEAQIAAFEAALTPKQE